MGIHATTLPLDSPTSRGYRSRCEPADRILNEAGVALLPGTAFGPGGERYLRLSYATRIEQIERALERMEPFFKSLA